MTTLSDIRDNVADMLLRQDLNSQIDREITRACERLNRMESYLSERAELKFTTVIGQDWYDSVDLSSSSGAGTNDSAAVPVSRILSVQYMKLNPGASGLDEDLTPVHFTRFQRLSEGTSSGGWPVCYTRHAERIGLWPVPSVAYTIELDAFVKPVVPTAANQESIYFEEVADLIETTAAAKIARKYIRDYEAAAAYEGAAAELWGEVEQENAVKQSSGRTRARD